MPSARARKRLTCERQILVGGGGATGIDEGETAIDGRFGAQCRPDLGCAAEREQCFSSWQAVLLPGSDILGKQYSTVHNEEAQLARRFRRVCRRLCGPLRDLPAQVAILNVDDALRDDLGSAACR
jgi:hypothetical protein